MILTTAEAAEMLRISEGGVRMLVLRGTLRPAVPGARPLRFHLLDVAEAQALRYSASERARLDSAAAVLASWPEAV